jgi:hypothetical protein
VVDSQQSSEYLAAAEVVHGEITAALVFVLEKAKTFGLARLFIADEVQMCRVAVLREYDTDVTLGEVKM